MDPSTVLFDVISNLTGGLVNDITTAMVGLVVISFILMGFDLLADLLQRSFSPSESELDELKKKSQWHEGTARGDYYESQYRQKLRKFRGRGITD